MDKKSFFMLMLAGVFWGTSPLFVSVLKSCGFSSWQMIVFRYTVSAAVMIAVVLLTDKSFLKVKKNQIFWILFSGLSLYGTSSFYYASITYSSAATAVSLMYTSPAIITLYSCLFMKEKINFLKVFSVAASVIGSALVAGFPFDIKGGFWGIFLKRKA